VVGQGTQQQLVDVEHMDPVAGSVGVRVGVRVGAGGQCGCAKTQVRGC
jgi:hypothetical protein